MKFRIALLFSFLFSSGMDAQHARFFDGMLLGVGVSAGQENFMGLPKLAAYKDFSLTPDKRGRTKYGFRTCSAYAGADAALFVFFAGAFSASATCGFAVGPFTIDNSFATTTTLNADGDRVYSYRTYNPKIGVNIGPVWLKAGPSYVIGGKVEMGNWCRIGSTYFNFEILYLHRTPAKRGH
jgi:hypothetical protein